MFFPFLTIFLVFATVTFVTMRRTSNKYKIEQENFIERERLANSTRKQSIDDLEYISFDISNIPMIETSNERILDLQKEISKLSELKIVNLSEFTNTDLKLQYGVANLPILTEYDQNFTSMCRILYDLSRQYYNEDHVDEAVKVLEYGVKCGTDLNTHYLLLADIYENNERYDKIDELIKQAENLKTLLKDSLIRKLNEKKNFKDKMDKILNNESLENIDL